MNRRAPDPAVVSSYQTRRAPRAALVVPVVLTAVFTWASVEFTRGQGPSPPALETVLAIAAFAGGVGFIWYLMLFGVYRLELTADSLRWRSTVRSGEVPLTELRRMRPGYRGSNSVVIEPAVRRPIRVVVRDGLPEFVADVRQAVPHLGASFGYPSGYRRGS